MAGLDDVARDVVMASNVHDIHQIFARLGDAEAAHKKESLIRRGMSRLRGPLTWLDAALSAASPLAALEPTASSAFGIARGVTTLAIGICGVEARLSGNIKQMLEQIAVIDDCDNVTQSFESKRIHNALVTVYKDLLAFYCSATEILTRQATVLALLSEQLNERLPPLVDNYVNDSKLLGQHIKNATDALLKKIEEMLIDDKVQRLLGAQRLPETRKRHNELSQSIAKEACEWALADDAFATWLAGCGDATLLSEQRILAVFGDMGCGKTITMAYLVDYIGLLYSSQMPRAMRCYYYIVSDETGRPLEVYLSLIQQLMDQKFLKILFDRWDEELKGKGMLGQTQDPFLLSQFLIKAVKAIERPLFIFVDGLDECRDSIDGGAGHILSVLKQCSEASPLVRVCVSSRNQQHIRSLLCDNLIMHVPRAAARDASIVTHIVERRLAYLDPEEQAIVVKGLSKAAEGSAIWVRLAVDLLAKRKIQAAPRLKKFIKEIPGTTVLDLYAKLYAQVTQNDFENCLLLSTALEILAVAERPMSVAEISWAVALAEEEREGSPPDSALCVADLAAIVDPDRLLDFLNPFIVSADVNHGDEHARQVRLNHHSVREHVLQSSPQQWAQLAANSRLARNQAQIDSRKAELHGQLARQCVRYLLIDDLKSLDLFTAEDKNTQAFDEMGGLGLMEGCFMEDHKDDPAPETVAATRLDYDEVPHQEPTILSDAEAEQGYYNPTDRGFGQFFVYASCYWLEHMHKANIQLPVYLADVLSLADERNSWAQNWWKQFYRPDCTVKEDESRQRPHFHDVLTLLSLYGSDSQLREAVSHQLSSATGYDDTARRMSPFSNAISEVLRIGNPERLPLLLPHERGRDLKEVADLFWLVLENWARDHRMETRSGDNEDGKYGPVFDHMLRASDLLIDQNWGNELLCMAASHGCLPVIRRLFSAAKESVPLRQEILRCPDRQGWDCAHQSVGMAAWNGHTAVVEYLLAQDGVCESHLRYRDQKGSTVLHIAMRRGDARMIRVLCERLPDAVNERRDNGDTPLQVLLFERRPVELATILLEFGGADVRGGNIKPGGCCEVGNMDVGLNGELSDWHEPLRMAARYGGLAMCRALVEGSGRHDLLWVVALQSKEIAAQLSSELGLE
ncbi:uncharacterized protein B0I36DRAFT_265433 [Microdochium trichocladiopsis]|uniref:Nephrocystin 3-like N-terminal domain-containing protein n=1 Tax=Microdochium trichocladiopsis TaxID=1682393 RepID=A0A9P9BTV1_9PEZI|nr:uncharacterized protein B0I36DRAFT_265433 [Microdochium trichocladiopsis]KAH7035969.1 hypothetical protein B0I36DRAFT_265433 [Microdochium trichocladiopsis]